MDAHFFSAIPQRIQLLDNGRVAVLDWIAPIPSGDIRDKVTRYWRWARATNDTLLVTQAVFPWQVRIALPEIGLAGAGEARVDTDAGGAAPARVLIKPVSCGA